MNRLLQQIGEMKHILTFILIAFTSPCFSQQSVPLIFDTDIGPDYDDVGAMALLHAFADKGEAKILATISCNAFERTAPTISVLNTYFGRPEIPIGIVKGDFPNKDCKQKWAEAIVKRYPHQLKANAEAIDAVDLYRRILSTQPDASVTIVTVGFFTNLSNLLKSKGDKHSPLDGKALVAKKVKRLVSMAAGLGEDGRGMAEFNVKIDAEATKLVFEQWPTPLVLSGFEIGLRIITGSRLVASTTIVNSPVKDAYKIALRADKNTKGRHSWDQTAVLVAVRGADPYFGTRMINFEIQQDGTSKVIDGNKFIYLTEKMPADEVATVIENLMMHIPAKK
jgi:inosine-uridine nucleoside N-ribohydrolase